MSKLTDTPISKGLSRTRLAMECEGAAMMVEALTRPDLDRASHHSPERSEPVLGIATQAWRRSRLDS